MNKNINTLFTFIIGAALGSVITYKVVGTKYKNIADEEIQSVIDRFSNREPLENNDNHEKSFNEVEPDRFSTSKNKVSEYKEVVERVGYNKVSDEKPKRGRKKKSEAEEEAAVAMDDDRRIYTIPPEEFNVLSNYTSETLYYSSDNYLLNSNYKVMSDSEISNTIGHDPAGHFGEYEDDSVCIRNEELMCDYEILLSMKTHDQIMEG